MLADIEAPALERAVDQLRDAGARALGVRTDVAVLADFEALRDAALSEFGAVHLVCNNAGVAGGVAADARIEQWQWVLGVNLWGVVHGCTTFLPLLLEQDHGHIVNTGSLAGFRGMQSLGVYSAS